MHCPPNLPNILADCRNHISETSLSTVVTNPFSPVMCALGHTSFLDCLCLSASLRSRLICKAFSFPVMSLLDGRLAHVIQSNNGDPWGLEYEANSSLRNSYHASSNSGLVPFVSRASITSFISSADRLRVTFDPTISYVMTSAFFAVAVLLRYLSKVQL